MLTRIPVRMQPLPSPSGMTKLSQINLQFHAADDRLLLLIKTDDLAEYRFWLTRRFVKMMWSALVQKMSSNQIVQSQPDSSAKDTVLSFQHEEALSRSDFDTAYSREVKATPLGSEPILIAKLNVKSDQSQTTLSLHPVEGQGIELGLTDMLLHSFCKLLADAVSKAEWDMALGVGKNLTPKGSGSKRVN